MEGEVIKSDKRILGVVFVDVFNIQIGVFRSQKKCRKYLADLGCVIDPVTGAHHGIARVDEGNGGEEWFSLIITKSARDGTLVHECVHMADFIMESLGIPTGVENTEIRAYLTQHIFCEAGVILEG